MANGFIILNISVDPETWKAEYFVEGEPLRDVESALQLDDPVVHQAIREAFFRCDNGFNVTGARLVWKTVTVNFGASMQMVECGDEDCENGEHEGWFCVLCSQEIAPVWDAGFGPLEHAKRIASHYTDCHGGAGNIEVPV